jgi:ABC-type Fe3+-hydroxamate transport system substrate-binding protein
MTERIFIDQMGRRVEVVQSPSRIVSLVPSQTELLHYLGLDNSVVGITKFCIHPAEWFNSKQRIGGTKKLKIQEIIDLKPDLIIGNKEENTEEDILALSEIVPVWMSNVNSVEDAFSMIEEIGKLTNTFTKANKLTHELREKFQQISTVGRNKKVLYCIWENPTMVAGTDTYIHSVLSSIGFVNEMKPPRYPTISDFDALKPDLVFLSSEPFPFSESHVKKYQEIFPSAEVRLVDGEMFSWYGSRMLEAIDYFEKLSFT